MAVHQPESDPTAQSADSRYRIILTDIRGVGDSTRRKLSQIGIESVEEVHLLRWGRSPSYNRLKDCGVGKDTLEHLRAVGKAVHHTGSDRVRAKHLTHPDAQGVRDSRYISLTVDDTDTQDDSQQTLDEQLAEPDRDRLTEAVAEIQDEYDGGYGEQVSFEADINRHIHDNDQFTPDDHGLPTGLVQSIVRYEHGAERVTAQRDYEQAHGHLLISFAEELPH